MVSKLAWSDWKPIKEANMTSTKPIIFNFCFRPTKPMRKFIEPPTLVVWFGEMAKIWKWKVRIRVSNTKFARKHYYIWVFSPLKFLRCCYIESFSRTVERVIRGTYWDEIIFFLSGSPFACLDHLSNHICWNYVLSIVYIHSGIR